MATSKAKRPFKAGDVVYMPEYNVCCIVLANEPTRYITFNSVCLASGELADIPDGNNMAQHATPTQKKIYFQHLTRLVVESIERKKNKNNQNN